MAKVGDDLCIQALSASAGIRDYHTLYDSGDNQTLKTKCPNPNALLKDLDVVVPKEKTKVEKKPVDEVHTFVVKTRRKAKLRIALLDEKHKPLEGKSWEMKAPVEKKGKLGSDGLIEIEDLPLDARTASLKVTFRDEYKKPKKKKKKKKAEKPAADAPPKYPAPIDASEYKDEAPEEPAADSHVVEWDLSIGGVPTHKDGSGVQARLRNLGFGCKPGDEEEKTTRAVKAYQLAHMNQEDGSGKTADIADDIAKRHDEA